MVELNLWTRHEIELERLRQAIPGGPAGWAPERLIFRDWWHWRDHELGFAHGRLALTGQNGSGKSTLLSLCLPTLLDGETSGGRLDPAMSRDRHLHWYLLGDEDADPEQPDAFAYSARTGYLALELRHGTTGAYLTIGMGVSAARNHPRLVREWWGFIVPERRLGRDWDVRGEEAGNCVGLRDLRAVLPAPCVVTEEKAEYRRQVNAHLFGMEDDDYQALVSMLLQARRPKLGEQAGPDHVCRLLRDSLPGVAAERLDRVAEVVENIERYQRNLRDATRRAEAVALVDARLREVAEILTQEAARQYQEVAGTLGSVAARLQKARAGLAAAVEESDQLRVRSENRATRLREIAASLGAYRERPDADLPRQLAAAQAAMRAAEGHATQLTRLLEQRLGDVGDQDAALLRTQERFGRRRDDVVRQWQQLAVAAGTEVWGAGERALQQAVRGLQGLGVVSEEAALSAVWPQPRLAAEGRALERAYRDAAEKRKARDVAEIEAQRLRERMAALRSAQAEAMDTEGRAEEHLAASRQELLDALEAWRLASTALALDPRALAPVALAVAAMEEVPGDGPSGLLVDVARAAEARRRALDAQRRQGLEEAGRAAVLVESLETEIAAIEQDGVLPDRSALRREARATAEGQHGVRPLFHWMRFKDGVDEAIAAVVEAAGLEAGLFDLMVDAGARDAWVVPPSAAWPGGPTLLEVLEPEPGAPPMVAAALGTVGWGEGPGDTWIAPDGRWRHGQAAGQVAPWLGLPTGVVGSDRRAAAGRARREALGRAHQGAVERRAAALERAASADRAAAALDTERQAAFGLPWQPLFSAVRDRAFASRVVEESRKRVEDARPAYDAAVAAHQDAHAAYENALEWLPEARPLDAEGLQARAGELDRVVHRLGQLQPEDLLEIVRAHREQAERRVRDAAEAERLRPDVAEAERVAAGARAQAVALEQRLADPDVARLRREIEILEAERLQREDDGRQDEQRSRVLFDQAASYRTLIAELEPQDTDLRSRASERLERLRERLGLHESLVEHVEALEREGQVAALPRLPRPVPEGTADALEVATQAAKAKLHTFVHQHMDVLGEARPTPSAAWDTVSFHVEREEVSAAELGRRLAADVERDRQLIADEEQQLYERIIYHGILDELRQLISRARAFTKRTNDRLRGRRLSSGERLSLRLSACDAATVPGAVVGKALEELDQGGEWLSEERREVLLHQIRAEVERVRAEAQASGEVLGYYEAIRRGLDYRRWYEYHLMSEPSGAAQPVEVRSRGFGRWSTSAKAWALAVPVLAGVAARYEAAGKPDAPALVGLDEAFAGFDPNNQANYLRLLSDLGLHWVITCPEELPYGTGLSAAMAYRLSLDGNVHMAFPVLWDGQRVTEPLPEGEDPAEVAGKTEVAAAGDAP